MLVLHGLVAVSRLGQLRRVVEKSRRDSLGDAFELRRVRRYLDLNAFAEPFELLSNIARSVKASDLDEVLVAPLFE